MYIYIIYVKVVGQPSHSGYYVEECTISTITRPQLISAYYGILCNGSTRDNDIDNPHSMSVRRNNISTSYCNGTDSLCRGDTDTAIA